MEGEQLVKEGGDEEKESIVASMDKGKRGHGLREAWKK